MAINPIQNGELGSSVRSKLNQAIQEANKVSGKQDSSGLGSAAFESVDAFDPVGSAQEAEDFAVQRENHTGEQGISTVSGLRDELDRRVIYVDTMDALLALDTSGLVEGQVAVVNGVGVFSFSSESSSFGQPSGGKITIRIPEDFEDLHAALGYIKGVSYPNGFNWDVLISSGHVLTSGFRVDNATLRNVTISSEDSVVHADPQMVLFSNTDLDSTIPRGENNAFVFVNSTGIEWNVLVDMTGTDAQYGLHVIYNSSITVSPGKGVKNCKSGTNCFVGNLSNINAPQSVFTGADISGVAVTVSSTAHLQEAHIGGGLQALDCARGAIAYCFKAKIEGGSRGIYSRRALVFGQYAEVSADDVLVFADSGSHVEVTNGIFDRNTDETAGIYFLCTASSILMLHEAEKKNGTPWQRENFSQIPNYVQDSGIIFIRTGDGRGSSSAVALGGASFYSNLFFDTREVAAGEESVVFTRSGQTIISSGMVFGPDAGVRIRLNGELIYNDVARARGKNQSGELFSVKPIPPLNVNGDLEISVYNRASLGTAEFGGILTRVS